MADNGVGVPGLIGAGGVIGPRLAGATGAMPRAQSRAVSEFAQLASGVRAAGLLRRRPGAYAARAAVLFTALVVVAVVAVVIGDAWTQMGVALVLGAVLSQFGFLAHDAAHRQVFASARANVWAGQLLSAGVVGLSYGWWMHKHSRHHRSPNQQTRDPDIAAGALAFTSDAAAARPGWLGAVTRRQGYLFFPLLLLEGVNLHVAGIRTLARRPDLPHRLLEAALLLLRFGGYLAAVFTLMSPVRAVTFLAVQLAVFGLLLGAAFAPNHKGMPIVPADLRLDFVRRQVLTSRNISGGWLVELAMGGLNYQVEHHLFPNMPRDNLRRARPIVRAFGTEQHIRYTETTLLQSYGIVVRYLNQVGLRERDPFTCPFVATYRR